MSQPSKPRRCDDDRGSVALIFVIIATAALAMAGLVIDGGAALSTRERAADLALQASRAGADALSPVSLRGDPAGLTADPAAARTAAMRVLVAGGATGEVSVDGPTVTVTVHLPRRTTILSAFGVGDVDQSATASATAVFGGTQREGR